MSSTEIDRIEEQVYEGIRKTVRRFRLRPYEFFTEAELHTSLRQDMVSGCAAMTHRVGPISVSLVHQEYPTNFLYKKSKLVPKTPGVAPGYSDDELEKTSVAPKREGDRGNFDLVVLSPDFVGRFLSGSVPYAKRFREGLKHVINKRVELPSKRLDKDPGAFREELLFALEVKYVHLFNAGSMKMLGEVIADCEKLKLALRHSAPSDGESGFIKPVNLVFCSGSRPKSRGPDKPQTKSIGLLKELAEKGEVKHPDTGLTYQVPEGVVLVFVESYLDLNIGEKVKTTPKPSIYPDTQTGWIGELREVVLRLQSAEECPL